jgi:glutamyl-tRNA reductase
VSCTGAIQPVITRADTASAARRRLPGRPLVLLDLALPRDIEPAAGKLSGVQLIDLDAIGAAGEFAGQQQAIAAVRQIAGHELASYVGADRAASVAPVVVALRARADAVVAAELARLTGKLSGLDQQAKREIARSMSRIAGKLLHAPTVRVKELAGAPVADSYEAALRVLFDLDPAAIQAVAQADQDAPPRSRGEVR